MASLIPRGLGDLSSASDTPEGFSRNESKTLARLQNAELTRGLVAATRVQARGFVAGIGIQAVGMLSREAEFQAAGDPNVAARTNLIVDQFAMAVAREVGQP